MKILTLALLTICAGGGDLEQGLDELISVLDRGDTPGGAVAILRAGEPDFVRTFGMADLAEQRPITADTPFYIASLAKPFTAACAVHAAEAGKLDLDASLRDTFPELPEAYAPATLRQCLSHRAGVLDIYDVAIGMDLGAEAVASNATALEILTLLPQLNFEPGSQFLYSNSGYVLLAEALRRETGQALPAYARAHIFEPRGMQSAAYIGDEQLNEPARVYGRAGQGWEERSVSTGLFGPGGLYMSLADLMLWAGEPPAPELLLAPEGEHNPTLGPYAAGWMLRDFGGHRVQQHHGGAFGFSSDFLHFPDLGLTVIALSNSSALNAADLAPEVARLVLGDRLKDPAPDTAPLPRGLIGAFAGLWRDPQTHELWFIRPLEDRFLVATFGDLKLEVAPVSDVRLEALAPQAPFALELVDGGLEVDRGATRRRLESVPFPPQDSPQLDEFLGEYESATLPAGITLENRDGRLALHQEWDLLELPAFLWVGDDTFLCDRGAILRFTRDNEGAIAGLVMDVNRARGLEFTRSR